MMIPELLNIIEAALYINSATQYGPCEADLACTESYDCDCYMHLHKLEMLASAVDLVASIMWCRTWWISHERIKGRGLTPYDLDLWSQLLLGG